MELSQSLPHQALSVVVPLFNEEENLKPLVTELFEVLGTHPSFHELVLVDDGSRDRTAALAREACAKEPRIRLVQHERNRGLGAAIRTGLGAATGDLILYTDADLPFDFKLIPELLAMAKPDLVVTGCRLNREGPRRWVLTKGYNLLCRLLLGFRLQDINFACKLIPGPAVRGMLLHSEGSFIDAEMLLECHRLGYRIAQYPMTYFPRTRGESTLSGPKVILGILREMSGYLDRTADLPGGQRLPVHRLVPLWKFGRRVLARIRPPQPPVQRPVARPAEKVGYGFAPEEIASETNSSLPS